MSKVPPIDPMYRAAAFTETYTGRASTPLKFDPGMVTIFDIAHPLANQCRYGGHVNTFYSTAQHCCLLASYTEKVLHGTPLDCLQILMHDAAESYLVDIPRPVKQYMPEYRQWDHNVTEGIRTWLGVADVPLPPFQEELDGRIIIDERAQLFRASGLDWGQRCKPLDIKIVPWAAAWAEKQFLMRYAAYSHAAFGGHIYLDESYVPGRLQASCDTSEGVNDIVEVDFLGKCAKVKRRSPDGMLIRDRSAPKPEAEWEWMHGTFTLVKGAPDVVRKAV